MVSLSSKEILAELKKLGIKTSSELKNYLKEYKLYYTPQKGIIIENREAITVGQDTKKGKTSS